MHENNSSDLPENLYWLLLYSMIGVVLTIMLISYHVYSLKLTDSRVEMLKAGATPLEITCMLEHDTSTRILCGGLTRNGK